tara:strand:- start:398 stop:1390 length:993 start_codon:yes stop_codon:yes gene_type:complete
MIEGIYSNVKGHIDLQLESRYNLVWGRNGSGKSAVIHSVELGAFDTAFDAAGKDVKAKGALEALAPKGDGLFCHLTVDGEELSWGDRQKPFDNVVAIAMRALTGSHEALVEFLLTHIDNDDHPIALDIPGWEARVKHHGSYRKALLEMMKSASSSIRTHQKRLRELGTVLEYLEDNGLDHEATCVNGERDHRESQIKEAKALKAKIDAEALIFVKGAFDVVEADVNRYLPEEIGRAEFVELGGKIRLSINGDVVIPSGVETVALAVALAGALLKGPRALFILPDRAYDPITLGWIMRSLRNVLCVGVFVQTTVLPEGYDFMALGWDLVRT